MVTPVGAPGLKTANAAASSEMPTMGGRVTLRVKKRRFTDGIATDCA